MSEYIQEAWTLLGVGMLTVFVILLVVVLIGNAIIRFINRFFPVADNGKAGALQSFGNARVAAISAAVTIVTQGKGHITKIQKK